MADEVTDPEPDRPAWWAAMEGRAQADADAEHWVAVYTSLIETMSAIARDVNGISPRIEEMRERLRYWETRRDREHAHSSEARIDARGATW